MYVDEEMDAFIDRVVPEAERATWQGADEDEIDELEVIARRPLPDFYRWFLSRMGGAFPHAELGYERQDLRLSTVIEAYDDGIVKSDPRYLLIGRITEPVMPELLFYDLDAPARDDAMVVTRALDGPTMQPTWETLREKLAWGMMRRHRVAQCPQRCEGHFADEGGKVMEHLDDAMKQLGFGRPVQTGAYCGLYEREDAAMASMDVVEDARGDLQFFRFGGPDPETLRAMLGRIATSTPLNVKIKRWTPPLPD